MNREPFHTRLAHIGVIGVLRAATAASAVGAGLAAARGGLRAIELTFTTPGVVGALSELRAGLPDGVLLGAGTVMTAHDAGAALDAGATFLVSPHLGEDVLELCRARGVPYLPGVLTPSEIARATRLGAEAVKLFPAGSGGGAAYLKDLLGPFPGLKVVATGGIGPAEVPAYRRAGAVAVGLGSRLFPQDALARGDWGAVEAETRQALAEAQGQE